MHRNYLPGLSLLLVLAASCVHDEASMEQESADASTQAQSRVAGPPEQTAPPDSHNSRNSLDWAGTYSGTLPCGDCPGIETVVTLRDDGTYERSMRYIDEASGAQTTGGKFSWGETGNAIALDTEGDVIEQYQVAENRLFRLDRDGQRITSELAPRYILEKHVHDPGIEERRWILVELRGEAVDTDPEAELTLRGENSLASGSTSCNSFSGRYAIKSGQRINFDRNIVSTRRACPQMRIESAFLDVLAMADNYSLDDGRTLSLNRARMAPLARFEMAPGDVD